MVRCDRERWENWNGDIVVERPERRCHPASLAELREVVADAVAAGKNLRACGSHWAFAPVAVSRDWFVETRELRATLYDVVPAALTEDARRELVEQDGSGPVFTYYHVQGGITIRDLCLRLDRQPLPPADRRWAALPTDGITGSWRGAGRRWALPTMGGAAGQTLAGAISTGTHGGDHELPPMADAVMAIHLIGPSGAEFWIERDTPLTDATRLAAIMPGVRHRASTELFDAVLVSIGRMGIIHSLVLRVVEQFWLEQVTTKSTWETESAGLRPPFAAFGTARSVEIVVLPYAKGGAHTCYRTVRREMLSAAVHPARKGFDLFGWTLSKVPMGPLVARLINLASRLGRSGLVRRALEAAIGWGRPRGMTGDLGYELSDLSELGTGYKADSLEVFFDAATGAHADFVEQDLFGVFERSAKAGRTVAGYVSLRFMGRSSGLLAMQRWDLTCSIEVSLLQGVDGNAEVQHALERAALQRGGTIHWGQDNTTTAADVAASFPALDRWRAGLAELTGAGPDLFGNAFCDDRGL